MGWTRGGPRFARPGRDGVGTSTRGRSAAGEGRDPPGGRRAVRPVRPGSRHGRRRAGSTPLGGFDGDPRFAPGRGPPELVNPDVEFGGVPDGFYPIAPGCWGPRARAAGMAGAGGAPRWNPDLGPPPEDDENSSAGEDATFRLRSRREKKKISFARSRSARVGARQSFPLSSRTLAYHVGTLRCDVVVNVLPASPPTMSSSFGTLLPSFTTTFPFGSLSPTFGSCPGRCFSASASAFWTLLPLLGLGLGLLIVGHLTAAGHRRSATPRPGPAHPPIPAARRAFSAALRLPLLALLVKRERAACVRGRRRRRSASRPTTARTIPEPAAPARRRCRCTRGRSRPAAALRLLLGLVVFRPWDDGLRLRRRAGRPRRPGSWALGSGACHAGGGAKTTRSRRVALWPVVARVEGFSIRQEAESPRTPMPLGSHNPGDGASVAGRPLEAHGGEAQGRAQEARP